MLMKFVLPLNDMFFEQRMEDNSRRTGVFHSPNIVQTIAQRRCRGNERCPEDHAQVFRREVHCVFLGVESFLASCWYSCHRVFTFFCTFWNNSFASAGAALLSILKRFSRFK